MNQYRDWNIAYDLFKRVDGWEPASPVDGQSQSAQLIRKLREEDYKKLGDRAYAFYERKVITCPHDRAEQAIHAIVDLIEQTIRDCVYDPRMRRTYHLESHETSLEVAGLEINRIPEENGVTTIEVIIGKNLRKMVAARSLQKEQTHGAGF